MGGAKENYIRAAIAVIKDGGDGAKLIKGIKAAMERRGHLSLLPAVLSGLERRLEKIVKTQNPRLIVAREIDAKRFSQIDKETEISVDRNIIGGYIYEAEGTITDNSYRSKLLNWYRTTLKSKE